MSSQVLGALIGALGALTGVVVGSTLTAQHQRRAWTRDRAARVSDDTRRVVTEFVAAARECRATILHANTKLINASSLSRNKHADGGPAATRALSLRVELLFFADTETVRASIAVLEALGRLAEGRAQHSAGSVPEPLVAECRRTELRFAAAARKQLGLKDLGGELEEIFGVNVERPHKSKS